MASNKDTLVEFVLRHAANEPVHQRVKVYRALASYLGHTKQEKELLDRAGELEAADRRCREFAFQFQQGGQS